MESRSLLRRTVKQGASGSITTNLHRASGRVSRNSGKFVEKLIDVRPAKIDYAAHGKTREVHISKVLEIISEGVTGAQPDKESLIANPALYGAVGFDRVIAVARRYTYRDHGFHWDNSGKNSFYSRFSYSP